MIGFNVREKNTAVKAAILEQLRSGKLRANGSENKLPSENDLARRLDVSLITVREALKALEFEGFISKKHGSGNYFHQSVLDLKMRIDLIADFTELLEDAGFRVTVRQEPHTFRKPSAREREVFGLEEKLLCFNRSYEADGRIAIIMKLLAPSSVLMIEPDTIREVTTLEELLWTHAREKIVNSRETLVPRNSTKEERQLFALEKQTPLIALDHVFYSIQDRVIGFAESVLNPEMMKMNLIRKWY